MRHFSLLHLKESPILSEGCNFHLTRELFIFLAVGKETIDLGDKYAFYHVYVKYQDVS